MSEKSLKSPTLIRNGLQDSILNIKPFAHDGLQGAAILVTIDYFSGFMCIDPLRNSITNIVTFIAPIQFEQHLGNG